MKNLLSIGTTFLISLGIVDSSTFIDPATMTVTSSASDVITSSPDPAKIIVSALVAVISNVLINFLNNLIKKRRARINSK